MGAIFIVVVVDVAGADRSVSVGTHAGGHLAPIHSHQPHLAGVFDGGRQDLRALVGADREGVGSAQDRARDRAVVVSQTRGHIDRNNGARLDGGKPVEELHGFRKRARERAVGTGAHDAVDPGVREKDLGPCGGVFDGAQRLAAEVDDAHARFLGGGEGAAVAALLEEVGGRSDSSAREDRAGVEGIPAVVSASNEGCNTASDPVDPFSVAAFLRIHAGFTVLAIPAHGQVRMAHDRGRDLARDVEHVAVRIALGNRLVNALCLQFPRVGEGQGGSINREHAPYCFTPCAPGVAA